MWEMVYLDELVSNYIPGFACNRKNEIGENQENAYPHFRTNNVGYYGKVNKSKIVYIPDTLVPEEKSLIEKNTILFNNTNSLELVGRVAYVGENINAAFSNHITKIKLFHKYIDSQWVAYYMTTLWVNGFFAKRCNKWIGQAGFNTKMLREQIVIPLPPAEEQKRIVNRINTLMGLIDNILVKQNQNQNESEKLVHVLVSGE